MLVHHTSYFENEGSMKGRNGLPTKTWLRSIRTIGKSNLLERYQFMQVVFVAMHIFPRDNFLSRTNVYYMLIAFSSISEQRLHRPGYNLTASCSPSHPGQRDTHHWCSHWFSFPQSTRLCACQTWRKHVHWQEGDGGHQDPVELPRWLQEWKNWGFCF